MLPVSCRTPSNWSITHHAARESFLKYKSDHTSVLLGILRQIPMREKVKYSFFSTYTKPLTVSPQANFLDFSFCVLLSLHRLCLSYLENSFCIFQIQTLLRKLPHARHTPPHPIFHPNLSGVKGCLTMVLLLHPVIVSLLLIWCHFQPIFILTRKKNHLILAWV